MFNLIPVFSTNFVNEAEKAPFNIPMMAPIPVRAIANLIPPSSAFENFTPKSKAKAVKTISIIIGAPISSMGLKNLLAKSIMTFINKSSRSYFIELYFLFY